VVPHAFPEQATRLRPDGTFGPMDGETDIGIPFRPIVTQISRWDRLKGFEPLLEAFARLKESIASRPVSDRHRRRLGKMRLVLAGPDPAAVADDPEAQSVLADLIHTYRGLPHWLQEDVALISLPMGLRHENALMVNALQRCSSVVVQNSIREGFGLTVTEAMWKQDPAQIADLLDSTLDDLPGRAHFGRSAQRRVHDEFLVFTQARRWLEVLADHVRA
jgi:trehalose synthase